MRRPSSEPRPSGVCLVLGSYVFIGGLTSLLGWTSNQPSLTDWTGSGISIQPNATICAMAAGAGLILLWLRQRALAAVAGGLAGLIGLATIIEYVAGIDLGIDTPLMFGYEWGRRGVLFPGRMGPPGSVSWTLIGASIVMASTGKAAARRIVPIVGGVVCSVSTLSLIGYLFAADLLHALPQLTVIAFQTSTFVFAAGLALIAAIPEHGLTAMLRRDDAAGVMARRVLIPILAVPVLIGWIRLVGEQAGFYDSAFGTAARTLSEIVLLSAAVWWTLRAIARLEDSRRSDRLALAVRDRLLGAVTEHAAVGLAIVDPDGRYLYANRQYASIVGLPAPQIVGRNIEESLRAVYSTQIDLRLQRAFAGERAQFELALPGHGSSGRADRLFDVIYEPQSGGAGVESVVMAITDITDRKATEQSLREQAHLLELAHDAIMLLEMDGTIVSWNHGAVETYGYTGRESIGRIAHELLRTEFPQPLSEIYETAERQGRWEGELGHTTKGGRRIVVASRWALQPATDGQPARVMEINRDVTHRKRIEAALHAKEAELDLITTTTPVILTRCSRDLRYLFVNEAAAALYGLTPLQMIAQPIVEIMGEEAFTRIRPAVERALQGETVDFESEISYPQAGLRWIRANYMPEWSAEGDVVGWIASAIDITDRRRVEEKLRESERTERLLSEIGVLATKLGVPEGLKLDDVIQSICEHVAAEIGVSRCGFGHVDLAAGHVTVDAESRSDLPPLKGAYAVSQYAPHLLADGVAGRITTMEDLATDPRTAERYAELYQPIGVRSSINIPLHRDGRWVAHFWISSEAPRAWTESEIERVLRTAERIWLVVEQTRVAMNLRDSEVRLARELAAAQHLQEVSSQLIQDAELDVQLRKILGASAAITGTTQGNIQLVDPTTGHLRIVVHQGLSARFLAHFADHGWDRGCEAARERRERVIVEDLTAIPEQSPESEVLLAEGIRAFQSTPIMERDGHVIGMLNDHFSSPHRSSESELRYLDLLARMAADLIERKQVEEALREADRRKDEFLATLAHELRNPLAPIRNAVHLLRPQTLQDSDGRLAHEIIDRQLQHLVRLVDDLMEVSRITSGRVELRKQRVDLASILASAVETVHDRIEESKHRLTLTLPPDSVTLDADPVRLTQVFANLLNNACKYTPTGGRIDVTARTEGAQVAVSVRDSGAGIPPPMLDTVFNLFTQVDRSLERSTGGLGIGLHLVRRLVELHGGTVSAHSQGENLGSEFVVRLPAPTLAEAPVAPVSGEDIGRRPLLRRRILLVDDNHDSVESLALLLDHQGHETEVAYDGQAAFDKASAWRPDVVLLDIGLPVMNGYDACRAIRRLPFAKDIRIIALSGWGQDQDRAMAREAGFDDHLVKPVNIAALMKLLDEPEPAQA